MFDYWRVNIEIIETLSFGSPAGALSNFQNQRMRLTQPDDETGSCLPREGAMTLEVLSLGVAHKVT